MNFSSTLEKKKQNKTKHMCKLLTWFTHKQTKTIPLFDVWMNPKEGSCRKRDISQYSNSKLCNSISKEKFKSSWPVCTLISYFASQGWLRLAKIHLTGGSDEVPTRQTSPISQAQKVEKVHFASWQMIQAEFHRIYSSLSYIIIFDIETPQPE